MSQYRFRGARALILPAAALALGGALVEAQQQAGGFASFFTGDVEVVDSSEMRSSRIRFSAGARTNWHVHAGRQLLLIESGEGRVQEQGGPVVVLGAGEPFYTQANLLHWHGAAPEQEAVQFSVYTGSLDWGDPVTDEQYLGR